MDSLRNGLYRVQVGTHYTQPLKKIIMDRREVRARLAIVKWADRHGVDARAARAAPAVAGAPLGPCAAAAHAGACAIGPKYLRVYALKRCFKLGVLAARAKEMTG